MIEGKDAVMYLVELMEDVNADMISDANTFESEDTKKMIENQCICHSIKIKYANSIQLNKAERDYLEHIIELHIWSVV